MRERPNQVDAGLESAKAEDSVTFGKAVNGCRAGSGST